jgi:hypothetical protein
LRLWICSSHREAPGKYKILLRPITLVSRRRRTLSVLKETLMVLSTANICAFGWKARDFALKGVDGKTYSLADV